MKRHANFKKNRRGRPIGWKFLIGPSFALICPRANFKKGFCLEKWRVTIQWRKARWCGGNGLGVNRGKQVRRLLFSVRKVFLGCVAPLLDSPRFTIEIFDREWHSTSFLKISARSKGPSIHAESLLNTCWTPANFRYITHTRYIERTTTWNLKCTLYKNGKCSARNATIARETRSWENKRVASQLIENKWSCLLH